MNTEKNRKPVHPCEVFREVIVSHLLEEGFTKEQIVARSGLSDAQFEDLLSGKLFITRPIAEGLAVAFHGDSNPEHGQLWLDMQDAHNAWREA